MPDLMNWKKKIEAGLEALLDSRRELDIRIQRQEGALMMVRELIEEESAAATSSEPTTPPSE